jgi:hypothetical protein
MISPYGPRAVGQEPARAGDKKEKAKKIDPSNDATRWQFMLEQLGEEARSLPRKESQPLVLAEIADAYWKLNKERAKELFTSALDDALALDGSNKETNVAIRRVLSLATKRDYDLARRLTTRILQQREKNEQAAFTPVAAALDLLQQDSRAAISLAEASAPGGFSRDSAWLIFQLASVDAPAAERVYRAYLKPFASGSTPPIEQLLWFAGYPFGYGESWGGAKNVSNMMGFGGFRITGLKPNTALAAAYLDIALRSIRATLDQAMLAVDSENDLLNSLALFALNYLGPEVARYRPEAMQLWSVLGREALAGTSPARKQIVTDRIRKIGELRAKISDYDSVESYASNRAQLDLEKAESLADGCERDQAYAKAALGIGGSKDFARALSIADKVKAPPLREKVRLYIYYNMSVAAIEAGEMEDAVLYANRMTARQQRTLLYAKIADEALRKKDRVRAGELLRETVRLANGVEDAGEQAAVFLAAAAVFSDFDHFEADQTIKSAIKAVNRAQAQNVDEFSVLRKVSLSCTGDGYPWYGSFEKTERFSLIRALAAAGLRDVEGTILMARGIEDPVIRIRALAAIIQAITQRAEAG